MEIEPFDWIGNFNKKNPFLGWEFLNYTNMNIFILSNDVGIEMSIWLNDERFLCMTLQREQVRTLPHMTLSCNF